MIKSTFYNLPDAKRQRVIDAIVVEFSNTEDEKVSINRIIKRANISRGSFYQYFDDKVDLVEVLFLTLVDMNIKDAYRALSESDGDIFALVGVNKAFDASQGDIFETFGALLDIIVGCGDDPVRHVVLKRLMRNLRVNNDLISDYMTNRFRGIDEFKDCCKHFNRSNLRFQSDEDLELMAQMLTGMLKNALFNYYVTEADYEQVKQRYLKKIQIVRQGAALTA